MSRIDMDISEYQAMKTKIKNLESALNTVSQEAATYKEVIEQAKALVEDLQHERVISRIFGWSEVVAPLKKLFKKQQKKI